MLVKRSRLERVYHGVYRVPQVSYTDFDRFMLAVLWTGAPEAVLSHDTALDAYEICDINPTEIHVTVAKRRRISRKGGEGYRVHFEDLQPGQIGWWEGIPIVKPHIAIAQCIASGVPSYLIRQAIERGQGLGLLHGDQSRLLSQQLEARSAQHA